ncbi:NAD(P)H-dependent oxidoreductase [Luteolibacter pohnpeiensis]|uniref:NAD(P)H-dependent oxidoreductase n=1 Tax=Luteolibacter pohnpeiensis TaxID=454153 RepID=A0A934S6G4_9BACT|nr:NAD(P)H-dependent oxidoreductase [Luteolibacter pohnpeiensis]MBK1883975.1 NAD(P)H-dependent oxidoreductase [Luteolibacter pohnpeiensis]
MTIAPDTLIDALNWRYATKKFDPKRQISDEVWAAVEKSMVLTPSSFGLQPWKFLIVKTPEIRTKLRAAAWGQSQVTDASHFVVFLARTDLVESEVSQWMERMAEVQGIPVNVLDPLKGAITGFVDPMPVSDRAAWNTRQVYIALGQLMLAASMLGIDTCPMEGMNPREFDDILGLNGSGYATAVACALGYRADDDHSSGRPKVRYDAARLIQTI